MRMHTVPADPRRMRLPVIVSQPLTPYLRWIDEFPGRLASGSRTVAVPVTDGPVASPRNVHGATVTSGRLRMRLTLPVPAGVQTTSASPSRATHSGVGTPVPSFRKVVSSTYLES